MRQNRMTDTYDSIPGPARFRQTLRSRLHFAAWTSLLVLLWPLALIIRGLERLMRHE